MAKSKYTNVFCIAVAALTLFAACALMGGESLGLAAARAEPAYAGRLFTTGKIHTIDIIVDESDWSEMLENASSEEYIQASAIIDNEAVKGVGLRPKGNSSLSMIRSADSDRYSFKLEFDHYSKGTSYYGLDKLALNNIAQDNTYMKDYVAYQMMNDMGADAPLSCFIWVTVNGEDWGLYLAVEAIEESFANRVYGNNYGKIYKPDTMDLNNRENWGGNAGNAQGGGAPSFGNGGTPGFGSGEAPGLENMSGFKTGGTPGFGNGEPQQGGRAPGWRDGGVPEGAASSANEAESPGTVENAPRARRQTGGGREGGMGGMFGGGDSAVSLKYSDDDPESYSAIFDNAAFIVSEADKARLVASLKQLSEGADIEEVVNTEEVMRYFAVHNFVLNTDSYTGSMTHNYYLYEKDGRLSMIAWDYNLAFGGMGDMGGGMRGFGASAEEESQTGAATAYVNYPIDDPMLSGSMEDKPMIAWIFSDEDYLAKYHAILSEYMEYFDSGEFAAMYDEAIALITPYVEKDPTAFCSYDDFLAGSSALREFCLLRAESVSGQLGGVIASTSEGQTETANANFVDASGVDMDSMGSSSMGFGGARGRNMWNRGEASADSPRNGSGRAESEDGESPVSPDEAPTGGRPQASSTGDGQNARRITPPNGSGRPGRIPADAGESNTEQFLAASRPSAQDGEAETPEGSAPGGFAEFGGQMAEPYSSSLAADENTMILAACGVALLGGIIFAKKFWT